MTGNPQDPRRGPEGPEAPDDELREEFQALRRDLTAGGGVPDFQTMMATARARAGARAPAPSSPRRPRVALLRWAPLAAAAAAAALLLLGGPGSDADAEFERLVSDYRTLASTGALRSPTRSLLDIPGVDLGAVPSFGPSSSGAGPGSASPEGRRP